MQDSPRCISITTGNALIEYWPDAQTTRTTFYDGTTVHAAPENTEEYRARARSLGYGDNTARCSYEHETLHTVIAEFLGEEYSPALWSVAHGDGGTLEDHWQEEARILAVQAWLNDPTRYDREHMGQLAAAVCMMNIPGGMAAYRAGLLSNLSIPGEEDTRR